MKTGDIVKITARLNEMWLEGECDGNTGILPVNFVKWLDSSPETDIIGNPGRAKGTIGPGIYIRCSALAGTNAAILSIHN